MKQYLIEWAIKIALCFPVVVISLETYRWTISNDYTQLGWYSALLAGAILSSIYGAVDEH